MENQYISELVSLVNQNVTATIPGYRYLPYLTEILALRVAGVKHRVIADWLNVKTREAGNPYVITKDTLANLISRWKKMGLIAVVDTENPGVIELAEQIKPSSRAMKFGDNQVENLEDQLNKNVENEKQFVEV